MFWRQYKYTTTPDLELNEKGGSKGGNQRIKAKSVKKEQAVSHPMPSGLLVFSKLDTMGNDKKKKKDSYIP